MYLDDRRGRKSRRPRKSLKRFKPLDKGTQSRTKPRSSFVNRESRKSLSTMSGTSKTKPSGKWRGKS